MLVGALVHDLGKSLSLFGEADGNVDCMNRVTAYEVDPADQVAVAAYGAKASGLDAVQFQYNHDRFGHDKLLANVRLGLIQLPQRVLDICKFHSLRELASVRDEAEKVYVRHVSPSTRTRLQARLKGLVTLVDGDVVSPQEATAFREHVASDGDVSRAAFVLHFAEYDLHSKNRTEEIPRDVDFGEVGLAPGVGAGGGPVFEDEGAGVAGPVEGGGMAGEGGEAAGGGSEGRRHCAAADVAVGGGRAEGRAPARAAMHLSALLALRPRLPRASPVSPLRARHRRARMLVRM
jgi:hypothetical protein